MFLEKYNEKLSDFARISGIVGARADYVQGGGGNTSVKLDDTLMAIKASGFCLKDIKKDHAYAVLDYKAIRNFYKENDPSGLSDVESEGAACTKANIKQIEGIESLRPSVEAGFHSILKTYVVHTHSVYANLAACSKTCVQIAGKAFEGADYAWGWVPYTDPGANLTFAIRDELARVKEDTGKDASVILMQNHGIIVTDDDPDRCVRIHEDANERLAGAFGMHDGDFPAVKIRKGEGDLLEADCPYLQEQLASGKITYKTLMDEPLYPDQMVFLADTFFADLSGLPENTCSMDTITGNVEFNMPESKAQVITETLTAVVFIMDNIRKAGFEVATMGDAAKDFIANWESEKYRKSLAGKK